ncbi:metal ABC transporter permease [bacterium]|nr:metal ABC transporter permease [bacterium]
MTQPQLEIIAVAVVVSAACALSGVFLVLRRLALVSDAISHSILLGIVLAFFLTHDLASPLLMIAAAATGLATVWLIELLNRTGRFKSDTSIGLVFPVLFSIGVILISRYAGNVHLDVDAVLVGEIAYAPLDRLSLLGLDLPKALWVMGGVLALNVAFIALFFKELKLSTFDAGLAAALGFAPALLHYALVAVVSVTAVGAFDAVGSILVVALMIAPPATAFLLTNRLVLMIVYSVGAAVLSSVGGYFLARFMDTNIAGAMAAMGGVVFVLALIFAPDRGLLAQLLRHRRQRWDFAARLLAVHLLQHEGDADAQYECSLPHLHEHLRWTADFARGVVQLAQRQGLVVCGGEQLQLTEPGRRLANTVLGQS